MKTHKLDASVGNEFDGVSKKAKEIAEQKNVLVEFDFNGVKCLVSKDTNTEWLYRDYSNSWTMEWKQVGPDCLPFYEPEVQAEYEKRSKAKEAKRAIEAEEYRLKEQKERSIFEGKVNGIALELSNADGWKLSRKKNTDPYGKAALDYAEGWAKLMQVEMANGKTLLECAERTSFELGFMGITGFMYGCAVSILSQTWKYGEELRKWHNKEYGVSEDKKGVVNPAVFTIGK